MTLTAYSLHTMVPTYIEPYERGEDRGELRIGWASWDKNFRDRSIKWAYRDSSGKISRGCPELPFDVLVEMVLLAQRQGELPREQIERMRQAFTT
jgi:hypothetical protein